MDILYIESDGGLMNSVCPGKIQESDKYLRECPSIETQEILTVSLDWLSRTYKLDPSYLKIDVEGSEFEVLKGAKRLLLNPSLRGIYIEVASDIDAIYDLLVNCGFVILNENETKLTEPRGGNWLALRS